MAVGIDGHCSCNIFKWHMYSVWRSFSRTFLSYSVLQQYSWITITTITTTTIHTFVHSAMIETDRPLGILAKVCEVYFVLCIFRYVYRAGSIFKASQLRDNVINHVCKKNISRPVKCPVNFVHRVVKIKELFQRCCIIKGYLANC